jgi:hypothetical protein
MAAQENKALVRRFVEEFWNQGNTATADELMAVDAAIYMPTGETLNLDELKSFASAWREAFPDWHSSFEEADRGRGQGGRTVDRSRHAPRRAAGHPSHR